jgi:hypothetical protein
MMSTKASDTKKTQTKTPNGVWMNVIVIAIAVLVAAGLVISGCGGSSKGGSSAKGMTNPPGVSAKIPLVGNEGNLKPLKKGAVQDWAQLYRWAQQPGNSWYWRCLKQRIGITKQDVRKYVKLGKRYDLRLILVSNSLLSDAQAREALRAKLPGVKGIDRLPVVRLSGFENTWLQSPGVWHPFWDARSQVRLSLGIPKDVNDLSMGFDVTRGVLAMCCNPWNLKKVIGPLPPSPPRPTPRHTPTPHPTPRHTPTPHPTKTLQPKNPKLIPTPLPVPSSVKPTPIATLTPPDRPAPPDPPAPNPYPTHTVNPVPTPTPTAGPGIPTPLPTATSPGTPAPPAPEPTKTSLPSPP